MKQSDDSKDRHGALPISVCTCVYLPRVSWNDARPVCEDLSEFSSLGANAEENYQLHGAQTILLEKPKVAQARKNIPVL